MMRDDAAHGGTVHGGPVLSVEDLSISYGPAALPIQAVRGVSFAIRAGEAYGLIGESGSGKSTIAYAIMRYLAGGRIDAGRILLEGRDVVTMPAAELARLRGNRVAMVYQDALGALNPAIRIGEQIAEALRLHRGLGRAAALAEAMELLAQVQLPDPAAIARRYAHQLSGGQQQRVVIAMALACRPALLIMDEPTTGQDVTTEAVLLDLIAELRRTIGTAILFISHNLAVVARICDRVGVLYAGEMMEEGAVEGVLRAPTHPYTNGLLACMPRLGAARGPLTALEGSLPDPRQRPAGCVFAPRCAFAAARCAAEKPAMIAAAPQRQHRCHFRLAFEQPASEAGAALPAAVAAPDPRAERLRAIGLGKRYASGRRLAFWRAPHVVQAVEDVSLSLRAGETLAVVGESGSGKSTLARLITGLTPADAGALAFEAEALARRVEARSRSQQRHVQIVFQNPDSALNPRHTVAELVGRPLRLYAGLSGAALRGRVRELLAAVKLSERHASRYPRELSGGEKQRVCIARAFAAGPRLVVCDEPTSSLDVSVQAAILNELVALQRRHGTSYLLISHDLAVVRTIADRVAVMYRGRVVESGPTAAVFAPPHHPYTEALLAAVPSIDMRPRRRPAPPRRPAGGIDGTRRGCIYQAACPRKLGRICEETPPPVLALGDGRSIACHIAPADLHSLQDAEITAAAKLA